MKQKYGILWVLVGIIAILFVTHSSASAAPKVVVVPLGGAVGNATPSDVVKGKTFSSNAGKGLIGTLVLSPKYQIGNFGPARGLVIFVSSDGQHGLEAAPEDQGWGHWGCVGTVIYGADGTSVGTGAQNTFDILAGCNEMGIAAEVAVDYELNGYTDWFLPSKDELNLMYENIGQGATPPLTNVGGFANDYYFSSTEYSAHDAWLQNFSDGNQLRDSKFMSLRVRAVRDF